MMVTKITSCVGLLCLITITSIVGSKADKDYYRGAVLQHVPFGVDDHSYSHTVIIEKNLETYELAAVAAAKDGADILVCPEWGLYPHGNETRESLLNYVEPIPDPQYTITNPCNEEEDFKDSQVLRKLSCIAKENNIFLVVNIIDKKDCLIKETCSEEEIDYCSTDENGCPDDGKVFFNTNVVFNREGDLVARYYKTHLYFEVGMDNPKKMEPIYFETDFGTFTTLICFDLMFIEAIKSVEKPGVLNVAYPTYWYDHSPYIYFATLYQQSWAMANQINLLASNVQFPNTGTLGSGIYSGDRGVLISTHNPHGSVKVLVANVPKDPRKDNSNVPIDPKRFIIVDGKVTMNNDKIESNFQEECTMDEILNPVDKFTDYRCNPSRLGHYTFKKLEEKSGNMEICSNGFCCSITYEADSMDEDYFFGVTGKPLDFYDSFLFGTEVCFLSRCAAVDGKACVNHILKSKTMFRNVEIKGNFSTSYIFPYAVDTDIQLTDKKSWNFDRKSTIEYKNTEETSLLFFGMYGRLYDQDKPLIE